VLFNAAEPFPSPREDTRLAWQTVATHCHVHRFEGGGHGFLKAPQIAALAERLDEQLPCGVDDLELQSGAEIHVASDNGIIPSHA